MNLKAFFAVVTTAVLLSASLAWADGPPIRVVLKDHHFTPSEIRVAANRPIILNVTNADALAEEFDSTALKWRR